MEDIGCSCCASVPVFKDLLQQFPKLKEQDIALMLGTMARTHTAEVAMGTGNQWAGVEEGVFLPLYTSFAPTYDEGKESLKDVKAWDTSVFVDTIKELVCSYLFRVLCCVNLHFTFM